MALICSQCLLRTLIAAPPLALLAGLGLTAPPLDAQEAPSRAEIALEQVWLTKSLGDEYFQMGNRAEARRLYERAQQILNVEAPSGSDPANTTRGRLLRAELRYRLALADDPRLDFWGARFALEPKFPVPALKTLLEHTRELEVLGQEIVVAMGDFGRADTEIIRSEVENLRSASAGRVADIQRLSADYLADYHQQRVENARERLTQIAVQTEALGRQQQQLVGQMDAIGAQLNGLVLSTVSNAAGLPVDLNAIGRGDLRGALLSAAAGAANTPEFRTAFAELGTTASQLVEAYDQANEVAGRVREGVHAFESARELIRAPTFSALEKLGSQLYSRLPPAARQDWERLILRQRPLLPLLERARNDPSVQQAFQAFLVARNVLREGQVSAAEIEAAVDEYARRLQAEGENARARIFDEVIRLIPAAPRGPVITSLVQQNLAAAYAAQNPPSTPSQPQLVGGDSPPASVPDATASNAQAGGQALQAMFAGGVTAIFPAAGLAQVGIQVLTSLKQIRLLGAQVNDIADQMAHYLAEEAQLRDQIDESARERVLAGYQSEIASERGREAAQELQLWNHYIDRQNAVSTRRRQAVRYRLGLAFYLSEQLREDFARLDRAVGTWSGALDARGSNLQEALEADLTQLRLALDPDIHLYTWLTSDREIESRRDLERLVVHWRQVSTLARDISFRMGISPDGGLIGTVTGTTGPDGGGWPIERLVPAEEWRSFRDWQARRGRTGGAGAAPQPFTFGVYVGPHGLPDAPPIAPPENGLRVVTVRLGVVGPNGGNPVMTNQITVRHPGFAYVPVYRPDDRRFRYVREFYVPHQESLQQPSDAGDLLDRLRTRWTAGYVPYPFEGYGLYTTWLVRVLPSPENFALRDIRIAFFYQYAEQPGEAELVALSEQETLTGSRNLPLRIERRFLEPVGSPLELQTKVELWRRPGGPLPPWTHGSVVSGDPAWWREYRARSRSAFHTWLRGGGR